MTPTNGSAGASGVRLRMRGALRESMRSRDVAAASALRSALAAIDHAVAIPLGHSGTTATASRLRREAQVLSDFIEG